MKIKVELSGVENELTKAKELHVAVVGMRATPNDKTEVDLEGDEDDLREFLAHMWNMGPYQEEINTLFESHSIIEELRSLDLLAESSHPAILVKLVDPNRPRLTELVFSNAVYNEDVVCISDAKRPNIKIAFHVSGTKQVIQALEQVSERISHKV